MRSRNEKLTKRRWRLPISAYLGIGLGGLVTTVLLLLLWIMLSAVFKNTTELLNDKSRLFLGSLTAQTRQFLDSTLAPSNVVAREIADDRVDPKDDTQIMPLMRTLLATTPQVTAMAYFDVDGTRVAAYWQGGEVLADRHSWPDRGEFRDAVEDVRTKRSVVWGPPIYEPGTGTYVNLRRPVFRGDAFIGMVTAVINVQVLSAFLGGLETEIGQNAFILYDRDYVLAHRTLIAPFRGLNEDRPLPKVTEIGDPVLAGIWQEGWEELRLVTGMGHADQRGDWSYVFLYDLLDDYADAPWLIGSYFPEGVIGAQFERMIASGVLSLLIVFLAIIFTYLFSRLLRKPIIQLAKSANAIQTFDFDRIDRLSPSRFAELDDAGRAFNGMVGALRTFSVYVPHKLVRKLVERGHPDAIQSEVRCVTVLMVDMVGFTGMAENLTAIETAAFVNQHLALITGCIEAEGGMIDKYVGDAVMALWGAIEDEQDPAARAVQAAVRIAEAVFEANLDRKDPVKLRIGIHSGPVVAGNIGTDTRMSYTVIGDTVNIAHRIEALGNSLLPENTVAILMSAEIASKLPSHFEITSLGQHMLRGRAVPAEIFTLSHFSLEAPSLRNG